MLIRSSSAGIFTGLLLGLGLLTLIAPLSFHGQGAAHGKESYRTLARLNEWSYGPRGGKFIHLGNNSAIPNAAGGQSGSEPQEIPGASITGPITDPLNHDIMVRVTAHYGDWLQTGIFVNGGEIVRFEPNPQSWACDAFRHCAGPVGLVHAGSAKNSPAAWQYPAGDAPPLALLARFGPSPGFAVGLQKDVTVPPGKWELFFVDNVREPQKRAAFGGHEVRIIIFDRPGQPDPPLQIQFSTYDRLPQPREPIFPFCQSTHRCGYINSMGKVVVPTIYIRTEAFSEGLGRVHSSNNMFGFVDSSGKVVIPIGFPDASDFHDGLARVTAGGKSGFIDRTGKYVIEPTIGEGPRAMPWNVDDFSDGLAFICDLNGKPGWIDRTGSFVLESPREDSDHWISATGKFNDGRVVIQFSPKQGSSESTYGYLTRNGKTLIPPRFTSANPFSEGYAAVATGEMANVKWGYIDMTGRVISDFKFTFADSFSEGFAAVGLAGKYGYINRKGTVVIQPKYDAANEFSGGLAAVCVGTKWGYIDTLDNMRITPQFTSASSFSGDLALVGLGAGYAYIGMDGKVVARTGVHP